MAEERGWRLVQGTEVGADGAVVFTGQYADANPAVGETDDRRIALLRARIKAHRSEATRLEVELDVVLAARAAGVSLWSTELPPLFLQQLLQLVWSWPWAQQSIRPSVHPPTLQVYQDGWTRATRPGMWAY